MDVAKRTALSDFYRDEFLRHIECLQAAGILDEENREVAERVRRAFLGRLDELCGCEQFQELAATVLQRFDTLSRLSDLDPRLPH
jgi:hypothetical protein